jgi:small subunit ribosomal protein S5
MAKNDRNDRRDRSRERTKDEAELIEKLVGINRVTKVVKGGKRLGFAAIVVVGDGKGRAGYGAGKAKEVPEAVRKATERARRTMVRIPLREGRTIHHDIKGRFGAGKIILRSAKPGTGIIAGGAVRYIFEALGVQDIVAKSVGSSNPHNVLKATFDALTSSNSPRHVATRRGKKVTDILSKRQVEVRE